MNRRRSLLLGVLLLALLRGLFYLAVIPPWQHYDEPSHFEYVRLLATRGRLPEPGDYDLAMRREIASSMFASGFWSRIGEPALDFWSETPPEIGASELHHPPLYYILQAVPQQLVQQQDVETQLYLARFVSVLCYVVVVGAVYGLVSNLFPSSLWLPLSVAAFVTLLSPFTDLMSSVNNDVGAAAAASLLLWAAVRTAIRGPSLGRVAALLTLVVVCLATKATAGILALAVVLAVILGYALRVVHPRVVRLASGLIAVLAALLLGISWSGNAAHWYGSEGSARSTRPAGSSAEGHSALRLARGEAALWGVVQELPWPEAYALRGQTVTFGGWLRTGGGSPGTVALDLEDGLSTHWHLARVDDAWAFHAITATIGSDARGVAVYLQLPDREDAAENILVDGVLLVAGEMPVAESPRFDSEQATTGQWGSERFENLLRNGSAETSGIALRPWLGRIDLFREQLAVVFQSLWEVSRTGWVYGPEIRFLFKSFWGGFGWNQIPLPAGHLYPLAALSLAGLAGSVVWLARHLWPGRSSRNRQEIPPGPQRGGSTPLRRALGILAVALAAAWGSTILRIHPVFMTRGLFWPVARYASVAIGPTALVLWGGLGVLAPARWRRALGLTGLIGLAGLDALTLLTVLLPYYYG